MANKCIFCGNPAGSREHIWPKWILERKNFGPFRLKRAGAPDLILNTELTTKAVCHDCNTGWMSKLEAAIKPILEPMFEGKSVSLDIYQQQLIALWMAKMAFVWDSTKGRNTDNAFFRNADGTALAQRIMPPFTAVWLAHIGEDYRSADGHDITLDEPPKRVGGGNVVTIVNEQFVAQIVSLRPDQMPTGPTAIQLDLAPGNWNDTLVRVWPQDNANPIRWPPPATLTILDYLLLRDRWRAGDETDHIIHL
jgi:hypothetical protein